MFYFLLLITKLIRIGLHSSFMPTIQPYVLPDANVLPLLLFWLKRVIDWLRGLRKMVTAQMYTETFTLCSNIIFLNCPLFYDLGFLEVN